MVTIDKTIRVERPVNMVYDQWIQFSQFPQFMRRIKQVEQIDLARSHWKAELGWKRKEWVAVIVEQVPNKKIAWRSVRGGVNFGHVDFASTGAHQTKLSIRLNYEPEGVAETLGNFLGLVSGGIASDLRRFKVFIEARTAPTGSWRGTLQSVCIQASHL